MHLGFRILVLAFASWQFPPALALQVRDCASTFDELRNLAGDASFALRWEETSMTDGKPLLVSITQKDGTLFLGFVKSREGFWAEGPVAICASNTAREMKARITRGRIHVGPAAHWLLRHSLDQGAEFTLRPLPAGQLHIATPGWSGVFSPALK